jgi:4-hydroxybenzoate polyprenyltransferase
VYQYPKNFFVFAPAFFSGRLKEENVFMQSCIAFVMFCLLSSVVYIINDILDLENDKNHPVKKQRPLASGNISVIQALVLLSGLILVFLATGILMKVSTIQAGPFIFYFILNLLYSLWMKRMVLVDVFTLSSGFVLRVLSGGMFTGIYVSHWLLIMTALVSLFLGFAKRRDDVLLMQSGHTHVRKSSQEYTLDFLNVLLSVLVSVLMVSYILYSLSPEVEARFSGRPVYPSSVFVLLALMRYLQKAIVFGKSADPSREVFNDPYIRFCLVGWILYFVILIYV